MTAMMKNLNDIYEILINHGLGTRHKLFEFTKSIIIHNIQNCTYVSEKNDFDVIFMETKNEATNEGEVIAKMNITPCMVVCKYSGGYKITLNDYAKPGIKTRTIMTSKQGLISFVKCLSQQRGDCCSINIKILGLLNSMKSIHYPG